MLPTLQHQFKSCENCSKEDSSWDQTKLHCFFFPCIFFPRSIWCTVAGHTNNGQETQPDKHTLNVESCWKGSERKLNLFKSCAGRIWLSQNDQPTIRSLWIDFFFHLYPVQTSFLLPLFLLYFYILAWWDKKRTWWCISEVVLKLWLVMAKCGAVINCHNLKPRCVSDLDILQVLVRGWGLFALVVYMLCIVAE